MLQPAVSVCFVMAWYCCFPLFATAGYTTHPSEVSALLAVKQQLQDPLKHLANWKRKTDPCISKWTGVICTQPQDGYYYVQELRCLSMNLTGNFAPELGQLKRMAILNFMWNQINGSIPKEIGSMTSLQMLLLSGNGISGPLPDELGYLPKLVLFQLDQNNISGTLPTSFANLRTAMHFHMNNNSISGQIPPELWNLSSLMHLLLDNNNLSGYLPPEFSRMPNLTILQLNNNNFNRAGIPESYGQMRKLLKLSLRNCRLQGPIPDLSGLPFLCYLDLSENQLNGSLPTTNISRNITTIDVSHNQLIGSLPESFSGLPSLQKLSIAENSLTGNIPSNLWQNVKENATLVLDFRNNFLTNISGILNPPSNVNLTLQGNPICTLGARQNMSRFCGPGTGAYSEPPWSFDGSSTTKSDCKPETCPTIVNFEYVPAAPGCFCALPLVVNWRLRSPSFWEFAPFRDNFTHYLTHNLALNSYQFKIDFFSWEEGPRLRILVKIFPPYNQTFNETELQLLVNLIATLSFPLNDLFGPFDLLGFTLYDHYKQVVLNLPLPGSGKSIPSIIGIVLGAVSFVISVSLVIVYVFRLRHKRQNPGRQPSSHQLPIRIEGVKAFSFAELQTATNGFDASSEIGYGGYGKVYKGILEDGMAVAIKRAHQGSLQGGKEFFTEIEFLSRLHHRNLVALVGYCCEEGEQLLVYEFMPNGSLHSLLAARYREPSSFQIRLQMALDAAKGILYLHTEADPPIIHRDVKANNILLDSKFTAKVSDFGISRLAPVPHGSGVATPVSTVVKGTPGYLDPEYFLTHKLTDKSDVYSLGIVFLELLTGMQPISHGKNIVREVNGARERGKMWKVIDRSMGKYQEECVERFMELATRCCQDATEGRPSMLEVVRELENISAAAAASFNIPQTASSPISSNTTPRNNTTTSSSSSSFLHNSSDQDHLFLLGSDLVSGDIPSINPR